MSIAEVTPEESENYKGLIVSSRLEKLEANATNADSNRKEMNETSSKAQANKTSEAQTETAAHTLPNPVRSALRRLDKILLNPVTNFTINAKL